MTAERESMCDHAPLISFATARGELERLQGQQEAIEKVVGPTQRGEAIRVVLSEYDKLREALDLVDNPYPIEVFPERTDEQRDAIFAAMRAVDRYATEWFYAHVARERGRVAREWIERTGE